MYNKNNQIPYVWQRETILAVLGWMAPRLLLCGTLFVELLRLSEWDRDAEWGRPEVICVMPAAVWAAAGDALAMWVAVFGCLVSLVRDCAVREDMERGQDMERRMRPERLGEQEGPRIGLGAGFQCTRPKTKNQSIWLQFKTHTFTHPPGSPRKLSQTLTF